MNRRSWASATFLVVALFPPHMAAGDVPLPTREGLLVRRIEGMTDMVPCGGGTRAWVWNETGTGLFIADQHGSLLNHDSPVAPKLAIKSVFSAADAEGAWISARDTARGEPDVKTYYLESCEPGTAIRAVEGIGGSVVDVRPVGHTTRKAVATWLPTGAYAPQSGLLQDNAVLSTFRVDDHQSSSLAVACKDGEQIWALGLDGNAPAALAAYDLTGSAIPRRTDVRECLANSYTQSQDFSGLNETTARFLQFDSDGIGRPPSSSTSPPIHFAMDFSGARMSPALLSAVHTALWTVGRGPQNSINFMSHVTVCAGGVEEPLRIIEEISNKGRTHSVGWKDHPGQVALFALSERMAWIHYDGLLHLFARNGDRVAHFQETATELIAVDSKSGRAWARTDTKVSLFEPRAEGIVEAQYMGPSKLADVYAWVPDGPSWLRTNEGIIRLEAANGASPAVLTGRRVLGVAVFADSSGAWIKTGLSDFEQGGVFVVRETSRDNTVKATLGTDSGLWSSDARPAPLLRPTSRSASVDVEWFGRVTDVRGTAAHVELTLEDERHERTLSRLTLADRRDILLDKFSWEPGTYAVNLRYTDNLGSDVTFRWPNVQVRATWWDTRIAHTLEAFAALLLSTVCAIVIRPRRVDLSRWLPPLAGLLAGAAEVKFMARADIDFPVLGGLIALTSFVSLAAGVFSPRVFRELADIAPYDRILPAAFSFGMFRRRLLKDYVSRVRGVLVEQRVVASDESYEPLPGGVERHPPVANGNAEPLRDTIVEALVAEKQDARAHVLIEAPAGRGKSALFRASVERLLVKFESDPRGPLPVLIPKLTGELDAAVVEELGRDGFSKAVVTAQLKKGLIVVAADALDEALWPPDALKRVVTGPYEGVHVLVASRPSAARRAALAHAARWIRVEPAALDDHTVATFEAGYIKSDPDKSHPLTPALRSLCRVDEKHYSPLLVRLAMRATTADPDSIASVYDLYTRVLSTLLRPDDPEKAGELLAKAGAVCKETHWATGQRELTSAQVPAHAEIVTTLAKASVIAPVGARQDIYRFFHASVQSFLTARALASDASEEVFAKAAGDSRFLQERSDLLGRPGSELFFFLVNALPRDVVAQRLKKKLGSWNESVGRDLGHSKVVDAAPPMVRADFEAWVAKEGQERSSAALLTELLRRVVEVADADARWRGLVDVFAAIAPAAYGLAGK